MYEIGRIPALPKGAEVVDQFKFCVSKIKIISYCQIRNDQVKMVINVS